MFDVIKHHLQTVQLVQVDIVLQLLRPLLLNKFLSVLLLIILVFFFTFLLLSILLLFILLLFILLLVVLLLFTDRLVLDRLILIRLDLNWILTFLIWIVNVRGLVLMLEIEWNSLEPKLMLGDLESTCSSNASHFPMIIPSLLFDFLEWWLLSPNKVILPHLQLHHLLRLVLLIQSNLGLL